MRVVSDISIHDIVCRSVHPSRRLAVFHHQRAHALCRDVAFLVFVSLLQIKHRDAVVLSGHCGWAAESGFLYSVSRSRHRNLVVVSKSFGAFVEADTPVHVLRTVFCSGDRFLHVAEIYRTGSQHLYVYHSESLAGLYVSHHLGAVAVAGMHVAVYRVVCLRDAHHLCHHVGCSPRRTTEVLVWVIVVDGHVWADGIYRLFLSADDGRLLDVSHHPVVHLSIFQQFKLLC